VAPHANILVRSVFGGVIALGAFWAAAASLRERWHACEGTSACLGYYARLMGIALAIILGWIFLIWIVAKLVTQ
jgi:hypothetical protein